MNDVIERLRASKEKALNEDYKAGFEDGRDWAKSYAEARQLEANANLVCDVNGHYDSLAAYLRECMAMIEGRVTPWSLSQLVYFQLYRKDQGNRDAAAFFWKSALGDDAGKVENPDFLRGFIEGAEEVWSAVKDQL